VKAEYDPKEDGNVFDWVLGAAEAERKRLAKPEPAVVTRQRRL
jgi:hypothetical protein